jgi:hypothetical protein
MLLWLLRAAAQRGPGGRRTASLARCASLALQPGGVGPPGDLGSSLSSSRQQVRERLVAVVWKCDQPLIGHPAQGEDCPARGAAAGLAAAAALSAASRGL